MSYNFTPFKEEVGKVKEWLAKELTGIRTGQATPAILDNVQVDSYGSKMAVSHVASITVEDVRTLRVTPWDKEMIKEIEKSLTVADLGLSVIIDDAGLRVVFPELTAERRGLLKKILGEKLEKARVSLRSEREKMWNDIQAQEKEGELTEDDKFGAKEELQKIVDDGIQAFDEMAQKKEKEISL